VFVNVTATVGVTVSVIVALAPLSSVPSAHEIVGPMALHVPREGLGGEASMTVAGRVSVSVTAVAALGPAFATVIV
jgi:hypothetical protein